MFRKVLPVCVVAALMASALLPSPARAQRTVKFNGAFAYFYDDPPGCEYVETYVDVFEAWTRYEPGRTEHTTTLAFQSIHYDACEDVAISAIDSFVVLPANAFRLQGLKSASLQLAVDFPDVAAGGALVPVLFDLTWTCEDEKPLHGGCGVAGLSGNVLVGSRNLMDSEFILGEFHKFKQR